MQDFSQEVYDAFSNMIETMINERVHTSSTGKVGKVSDNFSAELKPDPEITTDDGQKVQYPRLSDVKIIMPCGSDGSIGFAFPVSRGDGCVALYGEGGEGTDFKFDLSNAILLPGLSGSAGEQVKRAGSENAAIMFAPGSVIYVSKDKIEITRGNAKVTITNGSIKSSIGSTLIEASTGSTSITSPSISVKGNVSLAGNITITGNATVTGLLTVGGIVMNTHTHVSPAGPTGTPV